MTVSQSVSGRLSILVSQPGGAFVTLVPNASHNSSSGGENLTATKSDSSDSNGDSSRSGWKHEFVDRFVISNSMWIRFVCFFCFVLRIDGVDSRILTLCRIALLLVRASSYRRKRLPYRVSWKFLLQLTEVQILLVYILMIKENETFACLRAVWKSLSIWFCCCLRLLSIMWGWMYTMHLNCTMLFVMSSGGLDFLLYKTISSHYQFLQRYCSGFSSKRLKTRVSTLAMKSLTHFSFVIQVFPCLQRQYVVPRPRFCASSQSWRHYWGRR